MNTDLQAETLAALIRRRRTALTADELAELLSFSTQQLYAMAKAGRMPCIRIGTMVRFDPHTTAAWLESKTIPFHR